MRNSAIDDSVRQSQKAVESRRLSIAVSLERVRAGLPEPLSRSRHPAVRAKLGKRNRQAWSLYGGLGRRMTRNDPKMQRVLDAVQWQADHFEEIPVLVIACIRGARLPFPNVAAASYYGSVFPAVQNLLLAARAAGLGAALITLPLWSTFSARRILGLPWNVTPCAVIPLGWPAGRYGPTTRRPVGDVVSLDRYENRVWRGKD